MAPEPRTGRVVSATGTLRASARSRNHRRLQALYTERPADSARRAVFSSGVSVSRSRYDVLQDETRVASADLIDALGRGWESSSRNGPNDGVTQSLRSTVVTQ